MNIGAILVFAGKLCQYVDSFFYQNQPCLEVVFLNLRLQNSNNIKCKIPVQHAVVKIECFEFRIYHSRIYQLCASCVELHGLLVLLF